MANETIGQVADTATPSIADASIQNKIGFFAAMAMVVGATIGAGIFLRAGNVLSYSGGSLIMSIFSWLIAAFAIMAMALALVEIASARNDNTSFVGWCKTFNSRFIGQASKNYIAFVYTPVTYFGMPLYVILQLQDAIQTFSSYELEGGIIANNPQLDILIWTIVSLGISGWSWLTAGLSAKAADWQNRVISIVKIFPLAAAALFGFIALGLNPEVGEDMTAGFAEGNEYTSSIAQGQSFAFSSPFIGFFFAFGGIFFAYDGFYVVAGIQSEMKEPKKTPWALLGGLGIMTAIYLLIAISMSMNGGGSIYSWGDWFIETRNVPWVLGVINITITIGILGVLNGFSGWAPRLYEDLMAEGDFPLGKKELHKLNPAKPLVGLKYVVMLSVPTVILFTLIGAFYIEAPGYMGYDALEGVSYQLYPGMASMYSFADLTMNWLALISFMFIAFAIFGGLQNRRTNEVQVERAKWFVPTAWIAVVLVGIPTMIQFIAPFADVLSLSVLDVDTISHNLLIGDHNALNDDITSGDLTATELAAYNDRLNWLSSPEATKFYADRANTLFVDTAVGRSLALVALLLIFAISVVPYFIEEKRNPNRVYVQQGAFN